MFLCLFGDCLFNFFMFGWCDLRWVGLCMGCFWVLGFCFVSCFGAVLALVSGLARMAGVGSLI